MRKECGQTLGEYLLLAFLIAVVSIGAMSVFASNFSSSLPGLIDNIFNGGGSGVSSSSGAGSGTTGASSGLPAGVSGTDITVTTAGGTTFTIPDYPTNLQEAVETAGGNGTTNLLLGNLESIIQELEASGELTPAQINLLKDLANQGHVLAEYQQMAEDFDQMVAASGATSYSDYYAMTGMTTVNGGVFNYGGSSYIPAGTFDLSGGDGIGGGLNVSSMVIDLGTLGSVTQIIGSNGDPVWTESVTGGFPIAGDEAGQFISIFQDLKSAGVLDDPALGQLITAIGNDIIDVTGNQLDSLTERQFADDLTVTTFNESGVGALDGAGSASAICAAGGTVSCS